MNFHKIKSQNKVGNNNEAIQYGSNIVFSNKDSIPKPSQQYWNIKSSQFTNFIGHIVNAFRKGGKPIYNLGGSPTPDNSNLSVFLYNIINKILYPNNTIDPPITEQQVQDVLDQDKRDILASFTPTIDTTAIDEAKQLLQQVEAKFLLLDQKIQQAKNLI